MIINVVLSAFFSIQVPGRAKSDIRSLEWSTSSLGPPGIPAASFLGPSPAARSGRVDLYKLDTLGEHVSGVCTSPLQGYSFVCEVLSR